jgi:heptosyltransferase-2
MTPRILVIRGGAIGDFILTLPAIKLLRDHFPAAQIEILGYKHILVLAEKRFYAHATRCIEYAALAGFFVPNSALDPDLAAYFAGFQQIVSYLHDPEGFFEANLRRCGVKHFIHVPPKINDSAHAARQLARPLERLALYLENEAAELYPSGDDRSFAEQFLGKTRTPMIALHPGSGGEHKNWPPEKWIELVARIFSMGHRVLLAGGEADQKTLSVLCHAWREKEMHLARNLPLNQLAAVLARCALFVGHDSGISHLAAAAGVPCVLMFGPTDPEVWAPANPAVRVVRDASRRMDAIAVDLVMQKIDDALASEG